MNSDREDLPQGKRKKKSITHNNAPVPLAVCDDGECSIGAPGASASSTLHLTHSMRNTARNALIITLTQRVAEEYLQARHYGEEAIYSSTQLLRAAILWQLDTHPVRIFATPFLQHYFYRMFKDERKYDAWTTDPTAEAMAAFFTTSTIVIFDIVTSPASWSEATITATASVATNLATKLTTNAVYDNVKKDGISGVFNLFHDLKNGISSIKNYASGMYKDIFPPADPKKPLKNRHEKQPKYRRRYNYQ